MRAEQLPISAREHLGDKRGGAGGTRRQAVCAGLGLRVGAGVLDPIPRQVRGKGGQSQIRVLRIQWGPGGVAEATPPLEVNSGCSGDPGWRATGKRCIQL